MKFFVKNPSSTTISHQKVDLLARLECISFVAQFFEIKAFGLVLLWDSAAHHAANGDNQ